MLLDAEIKDDHYAALPRQQQAQYAYPAQTFLKADASTGRNYVDLNEAAKTYRGAWLYGEQDVEMVVDGLQARWRQWCPIPASIADGVLLKGTVVYRNSDKTYRMSNDTYEGILQTEDGLRHFIGHTTHTFVSKYLPGGTARVLANLDIPLMQRLAYNPMIVTPKHQLAYARNNYGGQQPFYQTARPYGHRYAPVASYQQAETQTYGQEQDSGF